MAESKWHLVSTFDRTQTLDEFCTSINFTRDTNENFIYRIKGGIEQGKEMKKENWYRVTIKDGKMEEYANGKWSELDSESSNDSSWKLPRCTAVWIFGRRGKYSASIYRDLKILEEFAYNFIGYSDRFSDMVDELLKNMATLKLKIQQNSEDENAIIDVIKSCYDNVYFFVYNGTIDLDFSIMDLPSNYLRNGMKRVSHGQK